MTHYICDDADENDDEVRWRQCIVCHPSLERIMSGSYTACEEKRFKNVQLL
jgi:hypothetical protein